MIPQTTNDLVLMYNMAGAIILCYILASICWFSIFFTNLKFKAAWPSALFFSGVEWLFYGYKNYDFYFILGSKMDIPHVIQNLGGALAWLVISFSMRMATKVILKEVAKLKNHILFLEQEIVQLNKLKD